jgi:hypothetical protein
MITEITLHLNTPVIPSPFKTIRMIFRIRFAASTVRMTIVIENKIRRSHLIRYIRPRAKFSATRKQRFGAMSGIVSKSAPTAEQLKISVPLLLEKKWGIFGKLDGLENEYAAIFCKFVLK